MSPDPGDLDVVGAAELVRTGEVSAAELVEAAIGRIEAAHGSNAVIWDRFEAALAEAPQASGPLAGVPFLLKELGDSFAGAPERMGCVALRDHVAEQDAWTVRRYREAGLVVLGTTNTPEWGNHCTTEPQLTGPTVNPRAGDRSAGGSSGGSAVAVATGLVAAASGGDGTGSIRVPASCCGVVGLKPRRGRKSFAPGAGHLLEGLVNEHVLTRSVRDCAALLDVSAGHAPGDPYGAPPPLRPFAEEVSEGDRPALRILTTTESPYPSDGTDPQVRAAVERVAGVLEDLGHAVGQGAPSIDAGAVTDAVAVLHGVSNVELLRFATEVLGREPADDEFEPSTRQMMEEGLRCSAERYAGAIATVHAQGRRFAEGVGAHDVLLVPTLLTTVPPLGLLNQARESVYEFFAIEFATTGWTSLANVSGWAAISLPLGTDEDGLPIGVQLMAPDEAVLLRLAGELERAVPWT